MLDSRFRKLGLGAFDFKRTPWYQTVLREAGSYKRNLLLYVLPVGSIVPPILSLIALQQGGDPHWTASVAASAAILAQMAIMLLVKRTKAFAWTTVTLLAAAIAFTVITPGCTPFAVFLFVVFPGIALQLHGSRVGSLVNGALFAAFALWWGLSAAGFLPPWGARIDPVSFAALLAVGAMLFLLSFLAEQRQEHLVGKLTELMVFSQSTGLPNREVLTYSIDPDSHYVFAIIKIENYSDLVALFGYEFSDTISQFASQKMRKYEPRFGYKTYHLKYNEYGILVPRNGVTSTVNTTQLLDEIIRSLELEALPWEQDRIRLVYRVGGTYVGPGDTRNPLSLADIALKKAERSQSVIMVYTEDTLERENSYNYVMRFSELVNNRENDTFRAVFQPVFKADGSGISWYEALLRVKRQDGTYTSIYPYLEVARSTGFYHHLTEFILRKSAEAILEFDINVSVNISIADIARSDFIILVEEIHDLIRDKAGKIIFEILESDELVELDKCIWFIDYVSRFGFRIAIDDFGTGYSNYINLLNLPIDIVKIDGSLIRRIGSDENAKTLVEGIVHFCRKSNKQTVAEYVEDMEVYDSLRNLDIDYFQGYYLSRPSPLSGPSVPGDS